MSGDGREPRTCPECGELCKHDGWGHVHANGIGIGSCAAPVQGSDGLRDANNVAVEDVRAIAEALGIGGHARPYSAHEVVQRDILPALRSLHAAEAAVQRVREVHQPIDRGTGPQCQGCATHVTFTPWPCPTVRALGSQPTGGERTC